MQVIAVMLILLLIAKDASHLGDRFIMRGLAQGMCLFGGAMWFLRGAFSNVFTRYAFILIYIAVNGISAIFSEYPVFVSLQVISFLSVALFAIAAVESDRGHGLINRTMLASSWFGYGLVCVASLLVIKLLPDVAYKTTDIAGGVRFVGVLGMPAMMAEASGILLGISMLGAHRLLPRMQTVIRLGAIPALVCLFLTGARTFWVAAAAAFLVTSWFYSKNRWQLYVGGLCLAVIVAVASIAIDVRISKDQMEKTLRPDSVTHLTGRVGIWERAFEKFQERPLLGYGFSATGATFISSRTLSSGEMARTNMAAITMHNGYIQAFLDSGFLGGALYGIIVVGGVFRLLRLDVERKFAAETFLVVFLAVSNLGESVIYTMGSFPSALFWVLAVFAFSMMRNVVPPTEVTPLINTFADSKESTTRDGLL